MINNINDTDAALQLINDFREDMPTFAIIKHTNPCGVAQRNTILDAYKEALSCDPTSAFGGILIANKTIDDLTAIEITKVFSEVIIAPDFSEKALEVFSSKKNLRIIKINQLSKLVEETGIPKGVVLKYAAAALATKNLNLLFPLIESDRFFSYLPLSHIAERALVEHGGIMSGGKIYFAETLDSFVENLKFCEPTIFFGVPRIYSKFKSKLLTKFPQGLINSLLKKNLQPMFHR